MKRKLFAVALVLCAITTAPAWGQYPPQAAMPAGYQPIPPFGGVGPAGPMGYPNPQAAEQAAQSKMMLEQYRSQYGVSPLFRRIFCGKNCSSCNGGHAHDGIFSHLCNKAQGAVPPPFPVGQGGTLAFPNHPFVHSPRDFFMLDQ